MTEKEVLEIVNKKLKSIGLVNYCDICEDYKQGVLRLYSYYESNKKEQDCFYEVCYQCRGTFEKKELGLTEGGRDET